jgi:DNA polymerase-1
MVSASESRLLLIDGHAAAYRFFHGIRPMYTSDGRPVQAVFGFIRMLQQFRSQWSPTHIAVAFDGGLPANRLELVPGYKAQRKPMPDELRMQLPFIFEYLEAAGVATFCLESVEADDVIATFVKMADGMVLVGTSDKDLFQLVNESVTIIPLAGKADQLDIEGVVAKTGVFPSQIPDWLAMTGDAADNIQGVPGVGAKTAAALLQQFGTVDVIYEKLDEVKSDRIRAALRSHKDIVFRNKDMVLLDDEIEGLPAVASLACGQEPFAPLREFYEKYEFQSFANKLREPELF